MQAPASSWLSQAQVALAENMVQREVLGPMLKGFAKDMESIGRSSGGLISASMKYTEPDVLDPLTEADDMRRVDFECHPGEPVKVIEDWQKQVRCLLCGEPAA